MRQWVSMSPEELEAEFEGLWLKIQNLILESRQREADLLLCELHDLEAFLSE